MGTLVSCLRSQYHQIQERFGFDHLASRLFHGVSWTTLGNVTASAATLLSSVFLARLFGPQAFGEFGLIQNTLAIFALLVGPALGYTATKYVAEFRLSDPHRLARILRMVTIVTYSMAVLGAAGILLGAGPIAGLLLKNPSLANGLRIAAFALLFSSINSLQAGALAGFEAFRTVAVANVGRGLVTLPGLWLGGRAFGPAGAVAGLTLSWAVACVISAVGLRRVRKRFNLARSAPGFWGEVPLLFSFSLPGWVTGLCVGASNWVGIVIVARQSSGMVQTGLLNAANQLGLILMFLPQIINQAALPILAERIGARDAEGVRTVFRRLVKVNLLATLPPALLLSVLSPFIMAWFGAHFVVGWPVMVVTVLAIPLYAVANAGLGLLTAQGRMWTSLAVYAPYPFIFIGVNLILVSQGAMACALARFLAFAVLAAVTFWQTRLPGGGDPASC